MIRFALAACVLLTALPAGAVEVPPAGQCPPYPLPPSAEGARAEDVVPPAFRMGERVPIEQLARLRDYPPPEVWNLREVFFFEGMLMEIGPCHRRYPVPGFFEQATRESKARLDEKGNLFDYSGTGLPFAWQEIADDQKAAGWKWAGTTATATRDRATAATSGSCTSCGAAGRSSGSPAASSCCQCTGSRTPGRRP